MFFKGKDQHLLLAITVFYRLIFFKNVRKLRVLYSIILDFLLRYHQKETFANKKLEIEIYSTNTLNNFSLPATTVIFHYVAIFILLI